LKTLAKSAAQKELEGLLITARLTRMIPSLETTQGRGTGKLYWPNNFSRMYGPFGPRKRAIRSAAIRKRGEESGISNSHYKISGFERFYGFG